MLWSVIILILTITGSLVPGQTRGECLRDFDAVLLVDGSESIGQANFDILKAALQDFVNTWMLQYSGIQLGLVLYSTDIDATLNLTNDRTQLVDDIGQLTYPGGLTYTNKSIKAGRDILRDQGRPSVPKVLIVITDGVSNDSPKTVSEAQSTRLENIAVKVVGIDKTVPETPSLWQFYQAELEAIQGDKSFTRVNDVSQFKQKAEQIAADICVRNVEIVSGLFDFRAFVGDTARLVVQLNHAGSRHGFIWKRDGIWLLAGISRSVTISRSLGYVYLYIYDVQEFDEGWYSYTIDGQETRGFMSVYPARNGRWTGWSNWFYTSCSATCGGQIPGTQNRTRSCSNPSPSSAGQPCDGDVVESRSQDCLKPACPDGFEVRLENKSFASGGEIFLTVTTTSTSVSSWTWTFNGVDLVNGSNVIIEQVGPVGNTFNLRITGIDGSNSGTYSFEADGSTTSATIGVQTVTNSFYFNWFSWSRVACSSSCGIGLQGLELRSRQCFQPPGAGNCQGPDTETRTVICPDVPCLVLEGPGLVRVQEGETIVLKARVQFSAIINGSWERDLAALIPSARLSFSDDGENYTLTITNAIASDSGDYAFVYGDQKAFGVVEVTVNGNWSPFIKWETRCGAFCRNGVPGTRERFRVCDDPPPTFGGAYCVGEARETKTITCPIVDCMSPVAGGWGFWTPWERSCSQTCGSGVTGTDTRSRFCDSPEPRNCGAPCVGMDFEEKTVTCAESGCPACLKDFDAVVVVDGSESIRPQNFVILQEALKIYVTSLFLTNVHVELGAVLYSAEVVDSFDLSSDPVAINNWIDTWTYPSNFTFTNTGIDEAVRIVTTQGRPNIPKAIIVVTDGLSTVQSLTRDSVRNAKDAGINLMVNCIKATHNEEEPTWPLFRAEMNTIATDERDVFFFDDYRQFKLKAPEVAGQVCILHVKIIDGLQNITMTAGDNFTLFAQLSHSGNFSGVWSLLGAHLDGNDPRRDIVTDGDYRRLTVYNANMFDGGLYSFTLEGQTVTGQVIVLDRRNGGWTDWSGWRISSCSETCGGDVPGTEVRTRTCTNPPPSLNGFSCDGADNETRGGTCLDRPPCPANVWSAWGQWAFFCPVTCGYSEPALTRNRTCVSPPCTGDTTERQQGTCNQACPTGTDGGWGDWTNGGAPSCSATCGYVSGTQLRTRLCDNPYPVPPGLPCAGNNFENQAITCRLHCCPV